MEKIHKYNPRKAFLLQNSEASLLYPRNLTTACALYGYEEPKRGNCFLADHQTPVTAAIPIISLLEKISLTSAHFHFTFLLSNSSCFTWYVLRELDFPFPPQRHPNPFSNLHNAIYTPPCPYFFLDKIGLIFLIITVKLFTN